MKNLILVLLVAAFFISCEKDENHPIVGYWKIDFIVYHSDSSRYGHKDDMTKDGYYDGNVIFKENGDFINTVDECNIEAFQTGDWYDENEFIYINGFKYIYVLDDDKLHMYTKSIVPGVNSGIDVFLGKD